MKSLKYVGVCIGAALLCGSMQSATLKEIEAQKKAEQAKMEAEQKARQFGKYQVLLINLEQEGESILTELSDEIPQAKKDMYMKVVREANIRIPEYKYSKNEIGHMIDEDMNKGTETAISATYYDCSLMTKYTRKYQSPQEKQKEIQRRAEENIFAGNFGLLDLCTVTIVEKITENYRHTHSKKWHAIRTANPYNPTKLAAKQSFAKWLKDVNFYGYIENLEINPKADDSDTERLQRRLKQIKENMTIQ